MKNKFTLYSETKLKVTFQKQKGEISNRYKTGEGEIPAHKVCENIFGGEFSNRLCSRLLRGFLFEQDYSSVSSSLKFYHYCHFEADLYFLNTYLSRQ